MAWTPHTAGMTKEQADFMTDAARRMHMPLNIPCPARCAFCYESVLVKRCPWINRLFIPPYTENSFTFIAGPRKRPPSSIPPWTVLQKKEGTVFYYPHCDFFSTGLTTRQIETLVRQHRRNKSALVAYTTGLNVDTHFVKHLFMNYPGSFKLHLSVITLQDTLRKKLMNPGIDIRHLYKLCALARNSLYFLFYFSLKQAQEDIASLNALSARNHSLIRLSKMYYHACSPDCVARLSGKADAALESIISYLMLNNDRLGNISRRLFIDPNSSILAWNNRERLAVLLAHYTGKPNSVFFCSEGSYRILRGLISRKTPVVPVKNYFGGCVDFAFGMPIRSIIGEIGRLLKDGRKVDHIFLPSSMLYASGRYDLYGDGITAIQGVYPSIRITVIPLSLLILNTLVSLDTCYRYYLAGKR